MFVILLISTLAGASIVVARNINSALANKIGLVQGTFYNYLTGLFTSFIFFIVTREFLSFSYNSFKAVPLWAYLGGLVGVVVVASSNIVTPKVPAFYLSLIMFIGQLFSGVLIDYFQFRDISSGKIIGGVLILLGLTYNLYIDKKTEPSEIGD